MIPKCREYRTKIPSPLCGAGGLKFFRENFENPLTNANVCDIIRREKKVVP
jgi:hypothetical protein